MKIIRLGLLISVILFFGCQTHTQRNLKSMLDSYKSSIEDFAFKNNLKLTIYDLDAIAYDTINENDVDNVRILHVDQKFRRCSELFNSYLDLANKEKTIMNLAQDIGGQNIIDIHKGEYENAKNNALKYLDSLGYYKKIDSLISIRIQNRTNPDIFYKTKFFLKATLSDGQKSENILDTLVIYFNKSLKIVNIEDYL